MRNHRDSTPVELSQDSGKFRREAQNTLAMAQQSRPKCRLNTCWHISASSQSRIENWLHAVIRRQPEHLVPLQVLPQRRVEQGRVRMTSRAQQLEFGIS